MTVAVCYRCFRFPGWPMAVVVVVEKECGNTPDWVTGCEFLQVWVHLPGLITI